MTRETVRGGAPSPRPAFALRATAGQALPPCPPKLEERRRMKGGEGEEGKWEREKSASLQSAAQEELADARVGEDLVGAVGDAHAAELQHDAVVRMGERLLGVLLDHQHRDAARAQLLEQLEQLLHQDGRQPDRGL